MELLVHESKPQGEWASTAGNDPHNFPGFTIRQALLWGEKNQKNPVIHGISGIVFCRWISTFILEDDLTGAQACWHTSPWRGDLVYLLRNVLSLFVLSASDLLSPWYVPSVASRIRFRW